MNLSAVQPRTIAWRFKADLCILTGQYTYHLAPFIRTVSKWPANTANTANSARRRLVLWEIA